MHGQTPELHNAKRGEHARVEVKDSFIVRFTETSAKLLLFDTNIV